VDEGLNNDDPRDAVWSPDGPEGWTVDRSGVPGFGTAADGMVEWAGWSFADPIWWSEVAGDQGRANFATGAGFVAAIADGDEWDDAFHEPGLMTTFMSTPPIPVAGLNANTSMTFISAWQPEGEQKATITASFDGGAPVEVMRWESNLESDFYMDIVDGEEIEVPISIPAGAQNVVLSFGYLDAGNNWYWAVDDIVLGNYFEDFESVVLGPNIEEGRAVPVDNVWTKTPPAGWAVEDMVPGMDEENDNNGITEWIGWSFTNKNWWVAAAGDQNRSQFTKGQGTVAVADPDEWDDAAHPDSASEGWYNTWLTTDDISLDGVDANSVVLQFDSSWRPEFDGDYQQSGNITVSFDGGEEIEVLRWLSDTASDFFKPDATDETVTLSIDNPAGASSMKITFGMFDAGNDWWWAIDNILVSGSGQGGIAGDFDGNGVLDAADINALTTASGSGANDAAFDLNSDGLVNAADVSTWAKDLFNSYIGDSNLDGEFSSGDLVTVFSAGRYETGQAAVWTQGDWNGDSVFNSSDLVAAFSDGGYEQGPRAAVSAVPEPSSVAMLLIGLLGLVRARRNR
jgi:hypothetical protein